MLVRCSPQQVILETEVFPEGVAVLVVKHLWMSDKAGIRFVSGGMGSTGSKYEDRELVPFEKDNMTLNGHVWEVRAYSLTEQGIPPEGFAQGSFLVTSCCEPFVPTPNIRKTSLSIYPMPDTDLQLPGTRRNPWCLNVTGVELQGKTLMPREHVCVTLPSFDPRATTLLLRTPGRSLWDRILDD